MNSGLITKKRFRASIACAGCRACRTKVSTLGHSVGTSCIRIHRMSRHTIANRRPQCIVGEGQTACDRCIRSGKTCVIRDDDERKR